MTEHSVPKLTKWPFILSDLFLLALAAWIVWRAGSPMSVWPMVICFGAVASGAWVCAIPFLREYDAGLKFAETDALTTAVAQIENLESVQSQIADATSRWQAIQESAGTTLQSAREVSERMAAQTQEFYCFFQRANDQEKNTLRLELEKMRRAEGEWLQVLVRMLDYVYALHHAGVRSGRPELISELTQFQNACRDTARRMGLIPFSPAQNEPFDARIHQVPDDQTNPEANSRITELLAPGFTFQTQLLRRALVRVAAAREEMLPGSEPVSLENAETDSGQAPASAAVSQGDAGAARKDEMLPS